MHSRLPWFDQTVADSDASRCGFSVLLLTMAEIVASLHDIEYAIRLPLLQLFVHDDAVHVWPIAPVSVAGSAPLDCGGYLLRRAS